MTAAFAHDPGPRPHCGRLTDHEPHEWRTSSYVALGRAVPGVPLSCPGETVAEGGHWDYCDYCRTRLTTDTTEATCGGCKVCLGCAVDNHCRECQTFRRDLAREAS